MLGGDVAPSVAACFNIASSSGCSAAATVCCAESAFPPKVNTGGISRTRLPPGVRHRFFRWSRLRVGD
jgi:hypothetical protein